MPDHATLIIPDTLQGVERYHRAVLPGLFRTKPPATQIDPSVRFLFLCFTNRCGSNFLAELMAASGRLNRAEEVYNGDTISLHVKARKLQSFPAYVNFLCDRLKRGQWFTSKTSLEQLLMLTETGVLDQILERSHFLLLERQDRLAQAISLLMAVQNQQWTSAQSARIPDEALTYDRGVIDEQMGEIQAQNFGFYRFFASNGIVPKHFTYEHLVTAPQPHLTEIGDWLGIGDLKAAAQDLPIRRQDSPVKHAWRQYYEAGI